MSNEDKKISQLPQASTLQGSELLLYGGASNGSVSAATLKAYAREGLVTQELLDAKLDKEVWDDEHEQFSLKSTYIDPKGSIFESSAFDCSGYIPLSHKFPLIIKSHTAGTGQTLAFYDAQLNALGVHKYEDTDVHEIQPVDFPASAVYFAVSKLAADKNAYYSNGPTQESREGAVSDAIQVSKDAAVLESLIAEATVAGAVYNRSTKFFELNGLTDITKEQMREILLKGVLRGPYFSSLQNLSLRTTITVTDDSFPVDFSYMCGDLPAMEVLALARNDTRQTTVRDMRYFISSATKLRRIIGRLNINNITSVVGKIALYGFLPVLEEIRLYNISSDFNLGNCPKLSLASLQYLVANAANTSAITITVHPDVYAKLTGDTTNAAASGLTEEELAQWQQVLADAAAKNITFATT